MGIQLNQDDFEQLLKAQADSFRMYPTERVWNSLYNNLHPGKKLPSVSIFLFFIFGFLLTGKLHHESPTLFQEKISVSNTNATKTPPSVISLKATNSTVRSKINNPIKRTTNQPLVYASFQNQKSNSLLTQPEEAHKYSIKDAEYGSNTVETSLQDQSNQTTNESVFNQNESKELLVNTGIEQKVKKIDSTLIAHENITTEPTDKAWIDDHAFYNTKRKANWKAKTAFSVYFTPSIGYRKLSQSNGNVPTNNALIAVPVANNSKEINSRLNQDKAVNIEIGTRVIYKLNKQINLRIGLQYNYVNYRINAYELNHPTSAQFLFNDLNNGSPIITAQSVNLANIPGTYNIKLNNNNYQFSIPIGLEYKIAGKKSIKWFAASSIQPTYIAGSRSYLISANYGYYVKNNNYTRKMNLNASFETFITYKTPGGITLMAGPQIRYQLLSTYSKAYPFNEKTYSTGFMIGIISRF